MEIWDADCMQIFSVNLLVAVTLLSRKRNAQWKYKQTHLGVPERSVFFIELCAHMIAFKC